MRALSMPPEVAAEGVGAEHPVVMEILAQLAAMEIPVQPAAMEMLLQLLLHATQHLPVTLHADAELLQIMAVTIKIIRR